MAESTIGKIIEFLIGFIILPRLATFLWIFLVPYFGLDVQTALLLKIGMYAVLIVITFFIRKMVAVGFIVGTIWDFIGAYLILNFNDKLAGLIS